MKKSILIMVLGAVFFPASVLAQTTGGAQNVLFRADFNSGNSPYQFEGQYPTGTNWAVSTVAGGGKDGSNAAHLLMTQNVDQFQSGWYFNGTKPGGGWTWNDVAYIRFRVKYDDNFRWDGSGSQQNKMVDIGSGSGSRVILHQEKERPTTPCSINYVDYSQAGNPMYYTPSYFGLPANAFNNGDYGFFSIKNGIDFPCTPPVLITHGVWYDVQMAVKLSSAPGVNDGYFKLWVNNNDVNSPSSQALSIVRNTDGWNTSWDFGGYWTNFGIRTQGWTVDDFVTATTFDSNWYTTGGSTTPAPDTTAPTTPANLSATTVSTTQINLAWTASTDAVGVTGYRIYRNGAQITTTTGTTYSNTGLTAATTYTYTVQAYDAAGNSSAQAAGVSATTQSAPTPTPTLTLSANPTSITTGNSTTLTWSSTNATSCTASNGWSGAKATSGTQTVTPPTTTTYTLSCTGAGGTTTQSVSVAVSSIATPTPTPTGVFFNEGFESGTAQSFLSQYYGNLATHTQFGIQQAIRAAGQYALRYQYLSGVMNNDFVTQHFGDSTKSPVLSGTAGNHYTDTYVQYKTYYSPGFSWSGGNNKQLIFGTDDGVSHSVCCNPWVAHYMTVLSGNNGTRGWFDAEANNKNTAGSQWIDLSPNYNGYNVTTNPYYIDSGRWYTVEVRRRLNDSGVANGIFEMWVDGTQIARYTNIQYRLPGTTNFAYGNNFAMLTKYISNPAPQNQETYYDDIKLSTSYIGVGGATTPAPTPDTTAPTTPTNPFAGAISTSQINLSWSVSTDNVSVTGYRLERCTGATCTTFAQIAAPSIIIYSDTNLTAGTTYRYRVRATDAAGNLSAYSSIVSATTQSVVAPTPVPTVILTAIPTTLAAGQNTTLTWSSTNATSCTGSNAWSGIKTTSGAQTFAPNVSGTYTLSCSGSGGSAAQSISLTVNPAVDSTAPVLVSAVVSNTTASSTRITVATNEAAIATLRYGLTATTLTNTVMSTTAGITHVFDLANLSRHITYAYQVTLRDTAGNTTTGPISAFTTLSHDPRPPRVTNVTATAGSVILAWTNPTYEYLGDIKIYRSTNNGNVLNNPDSAYHLATVPVSATTYTDTTVAQGTTYHYTIFTYDDQGAYSDPAEITFTTGSDTVVTTPPPAPTPSTPTGTVTTTPAPNTGGGGGSTSSGGSVVTTGGTTTQATNTSTGSTTTIPTTPTTPTIPSTTTYPPLTRPLGLGSRGDDVTTLQRMLAQDSNIYPEGDITGYYGPATQRAIQRFQIQHAIVSSGSPSTTGYGAVGPSTRAQLNTLYAGTTTPTASGLTPEKRALILEQIRLLQEQVKLLLQQLTLLLQRGRV
ncbi:MAG: hypothetical protein A2591_01635 [Candidatus Yonathbacteria bacterium RIFOXYD1_FULL_52_36]|uniref:Fibronectin type-III domain-containing protein n=1 Tax=Candidatus Yonathbacteria bacterium RIFOXYD1_FULL_52_36 TaxID=1802730 RepID=A0A1G2SKZ9_9BACT|nr:MAG: hypothetical protein A2591_01635 [Candidatus Yonathbacteria bacterium RIFOXYD1_FULL_52_36]